MNLIEDIGGDNLFTFVRFRCLYGILYKHVYLDMVFCTNMGIFDKVVQKNLLIRSTIVFIFLYEKEFLGIPVD